MFPQRAGRKLLGDLAAAKPFDGGAFFVAAGEEDDRLRLQDRADAHGDGVRRDVAVGEERRVRGARRFGQRDDARARVERRARLVEADVAVAAEAEEGEVESAGGGDLAFVARAFGVEIGAVPFGMCAFAGSMSTWSKRCCFMNV